MGSCRQTCDAISRKASRGCDTARMRLELPTLVHLPKVAPPHRHLVMAVGLQLEGPLAAALSVGEHEREAVGAW